MESLQTINKLEIETNKIFYDKKSEILSVYLLDFIFIGTYKKSTRLSKILDDIYQSLGDTHLKREEIRIIDFVSLTPLLEKTKLKQLKLISKREKEKRDLEEVEKEVAEEMQILDEKVRLEPVREFEKRKKGKKDKAFKLKEKPAVSKTKEAYYDDFDEELAMDEYEKKEEVVEFKASEIPSERARSSAPSSGAGAPASEESRAAPPSPTPPPPPGDAYAGPGAPPVKKFRDEIGEPDLIAPEEPKPTVYEINMGLQYYSVMMEKTSYLFYVYFSHKELKIIDEEGKAVFETSFRIETTKKEPPIVDLRVEGEGFEVHPLHGKVEIKKDAVNPPVMIFSVLPVKKGKRTKKQKKESERRYLHVYITYEDKTINHSILSIIVQPKHFRLDIGPFHLNISKRTAAIVSFLSVAVAVVSLLYTLLSIDPTSSFVNIISNFAPGLGSIIFFAIFLITLFKEGIYPLKEKISYFLNFDKTGMLIK